MLDAGVARLLPDAIEADDDEADEPAAGDAIGAWRIVRPLGRGGMGTVFLVERNDGQFAQTAALKLLRPGLSERDARVEGRFERERQVVESVAHASVARTATGRQQPAR